jgi:hypothetical protein
MRQLPASASTSYTIPVGSVACRSILTTSGGHRQDPGGQQAARAWQSPGCISLAVSVPRASRARCAGYGSACDARSKPCPDKGVSDTPRLEVASAGAVRPRWRLLATATQACRVTRRLPGRVRVRDARSVRQPDLARHRGGGAACPGWQVPARELGFLPRFARHVPANLPAPALAGGTTRVALQASRPGGAPMSRGRLPDGYVPERHPGQDP